MAVKEGLSTFSALNLHPITAQDQIRDGAKAAARKAKRAKPWVLPENSLIEVDFDHQTRADQAVFVPGVQRGGERTIVYRPVDGLDFIYIWRAVIKAASVRMMP